MRFKSLLELGIAVVLSIGLAQSPAQCQSGEPLKTVIPVTLQLHTGNIIVGSKVYPGTGNGMHVLALVRQPDLSHLDAPDVVGQDEIFTDAGSANAYLQSTRNSQPNALLLINDVGSSGFPLQQIADRLHNFGAAHDIDSIAEEIPLFFVGVGGTNVGQAHQVGFSNHDLTGYLALDSNGKYAFIQTDYVRFDMTTDGTIKIGSTAYTVAGSYMQPECDGSNSFRLVVVQRATPEVLVANNTYCTARFDGEIENLVTDLKGVIGREDQLTFLASNGHPIPANWNFGVDGDPRLYPLAQEVAQLGGFWETIAYMTPLDTFSLVGSARPPSWVQGPYRRARESSSVYPDQPTGELHGMLGRGRGDWYSPISSDPAGKANLGFYKILSQNPVPFPHPANQQELTAYQYIGQQLYQLDGGACASPCNLRDSYGDLNKSISVWLSNLENMRDAQGDDCSNPTNKTLPFCVMKAQLQTEFADVINIRAFDNNLSLLWAASGTNITLELGKVYNKISANLPPPPAQSPVPGLISTFTNFFLGLGSLIPEVGPIFGVADTVFNFATGLITDPSGNRVTSLNSTVATLYQQASTNFSAQAVTRGTQFDLIYQDWGKLSALGQALEDAQPGSGWYWDTNTPGLVLEAMQPALQQSTYRSLLAALYSVGSYVPGGWGTWGTSWGQTPLWQQPASYGANAANAQGEFAAQPFNISGDSWYVPYTYPTDPNTPYNDPKTPTSTLLGMGGWLGIGLQTDPGNPTAATGYLYQPPATAISSDLFTPVSAGGLSVYRPEFFESWPFPRLTCDVSSYEGDPGQGCNWGSGAPAAESFSNPLTRVSVSLGKSRNKTGVPGELDIPINIANSGTLDANSIEITRVSLRTASGSGQAELIDTPLPIHLGALKTGKFATATVRIRVPSTVLKLVVIEDGVIGNGERQPYKFSFGQAFFPQAKKS